MYPKKHEISVIQKKQGLRFLRKFKNSNGHWIQCLDAKGQVWVIPETSYKKYKLTGFPFLSKQLERKILEVLKQYPLEELKNPDVDKMFRAIVEVIQDSPAENLFPSLEIK
jgi:CTP:phosphocholine cytidylyltransferase-like protein